jgi:hypothetical protein
MVNGQHREFLIDHVHSSDLFNVSSLTHSMPYLADHVMIPLTNPGVNQKEESILKRDWKN